MQTKPADGKHGHTAQKAGQKGSRVKAPIDKDLPLEGVINASMNASPKIKVPCTRRFVECTVNSQMSSGSITDQGVTISVNEEEDDMLFGILQSSDNFGDLDHLMTDYPGDGVVQAATNTSHPDPAPISVDDVAATIRALSWEIPSPYTHGTAPFPDITATIDSSG